MREADRPARDRRQGTYWFGTLPVQPELEWAPCLPEGVTYIRGQLEEGEGGLIHFQLFFILPKKASLTAVRELWEPYVGHWELSRSKAAEEYVWKEETRIGEPFEFGERPFRRNSSTDWDVVKRNAQSGRLDEIPSDIYVRYYSSLCRIRGDSLQPAFVDRCCTVLWGDTGTGKSHRAWESCGIEAYSKDPRTKFWCGYSGQESVIFDEFRGAIDIAHLLRWCDKYPVRVEVKGGSVPLSAKKLVFTSNLHPSAWYPELDPVTYAALERRLEIVHVTEREDEVVEQEQ